MNYRWVAEEPNFHMPVKVIMNPEMSNLSIQPVNGSLFKLTAITLMLLRLMKDFISQAKYLNQRIRKTGRRI